jgi:hypothetical protein
MEIIEGMSDSEYDRVCTAGVELLESLRTLLSKHGLEDDQALGVLLIASGGVLITGNMEPEEYLRGLHMACGLWYSKEGAEGLSSASFAPHSHPQVFERRNGEN